MEIIDKATYYNKAMTAVVVNNNSDEDPLKAKRVQVYIPEIHGEDGAYKKVEEYKLDGNKSSRDDFRSYPWAYSTVANTVIGDIVYVMNLSNDISSFVIIGRDASCENSGGIGGSGELDAGSLAELVIPFIIHEECGYGNPPLYDQYWDNNIAGPCAVYTTKTSSNWSVGLLNWDGGRAWNLMFEIAKQDSNWKSYFSDQSQAFVTNMAYDVSTGSSRASNHSVMITGRTSVDSVIKGIKAMASSSVGQEVQRKQARQDVTGYVQGLMDEGISNPAILIYMADFCNQ